VISSPCTRKSIFWNLVYPQTSSLQQASANFCPDLCKSETDTEQCFRLLGIHSLGDPDCIQHTTACGCKVYCDFSKPHRFSEHGDVMYCEFASIIIHFDHLFEEVTSDPSTPRQSTATDNAEAISASPLPHAQKCPTSTPADAGIS
jgi:hypothetical protein